MDVNSAGFRKNRGWRAERRVRLAALVARPGWSCGRGDSQFIILSRAKHQRETPAGSFVLPRAARARTRARGSAESTRLLLEGGHGREPHPQSPSLAPSLSPPASLSLSSAAPPAAAPALIVDKDGGRRSTRAQKPRNPRGRSAERAILLPHRLFQGE